jgi:small subunit ribosomal protein S8
MVNDTISDFLTKIRNAINSKHHLVEVPYTKITKSIVKILKKEGFLDDFKIFENLNKKKILLSLKYSGKNKETIISSIQRISKPGLRTYVNNKTIPNVLGNLGIAIISTSKGIMTGSQAKTLNIGGEILCQIY